MTRWVMCCFGVISLSLLVCCGGGKKPQVEDNGLALPEDEDLRRNAVAMKASVVSVHMENPYAYTLRLKVDSVVAAEGTEFSVRRGDSLTVIPNFVYLGPGILDMRWEANRVLLALGRARKGERLNAVIARANDGTCMLIDGKRE